MGAQGVGNMESLCRGRGEFGINFLKKFMLVKSPTHTFRSIGLTDAGNAACFAQCIQRFVSFDLCLVFFPLSLVPQWEHRKIITPKGHLRSAALCHSCN